MQIFFFLFVLALLCKAFYDCQNAITTPSKSDYYPMFLELLLRVIFFNITECATLPNKDNKMIKLFPQKTSLPPPCKLQRREGSSTKRINRFNR